MHIHLCVSMRPSYIYVYMYIRGVPISGSGIGIGRHRAVCIGSVDRFEKQPISIPATPTLTAPPYGKNQPSTKLIITHVAIFTPSSAVST